MQFIVRLVLSSRLRDGGAPVSEREEVLARGNQPVDDTFDLLHRLPAPSLVCWQPIS